MADSRVRIGACCSREHPARPWFGDTYGLGPTPTALCGQVGFVGFGFGEHCCRSTKSAGFRSCLAAYWLLPHCPTSSPLYPPFLARRLSPAPPAIPDRHARTLARTHMPRHRLEHFTAASYGPVELARLRSVQYTEYSGRMRPLPVWTQEGELPAVPLRVAHSRSGRSAVDRTEPTPSAAPL